MGVVNLVNDECLSDDRLRMSPLPPLQACRRRHIPRINCIVTDYMALFDIQTAMNHAAGTNEDEFQIIYDRTTTTDVVRPAWHVYRVVARGGVPSEDSMVLEFSCKKDFSKPWSPENAREPGMWIVDHFKKQDKRRWSGSEQQVEEQIIREAEMANDRVRREAEQEQAEKTKHFAKEVDTFAVKNRVSRTWNKFKGKFND